MFAHGQLKILYRDLALPFKLLSELVSAVDPLYNSIETLKRRLPTYLPRMAIEQHDRPAFRYKASGVLVAGSPRYIFIIIRNIKLVCM